MKGASAIRAVWTSGDPVCPHPCPASSLTPVDLSCLIVDWDRERISIVTCAAEIPRHYSRLTFATTAFLHHSLSVPSSRWLQPRAYLPHVIACSADRAPECVPCCPLIEKQLLKRTGRVDPRWRAVACRAPAGCRSFGAAYLGRRLLRLCPPRYACLCV